jgi:hypothetical protein
VEEGSLKLEPEEEGLERTAREKSRRLPGRIIRRAHFVDRSRYTGARLRDLRRERGVGSVALRAIMCEVVAAHKKSGGSDTFIKNMTSRWVHNFSNSGHPFADFFPLSVADMFRDTAELPVKALGNVPLDHHHHHYANTNV